MIIYMKKLSLSGSYILRYIACGILLMGIEEERIRMAAHTRFVLLLTIAEAAIVIFRFSMFVYVRRKKIETDSPVNHFNDLYAGTLTLEYTVLLFALLSVFCTFVPIRIGLDNLLLFFIGFTDLVRGIILLALLHEQKKAKKAEEALRISDYTDK